MKAKIFFIASLALATLSTSCRKDFLEKEPTDFITNKRLKDLAEKTPKAGEPLQNGQLNGMYAWMYTEGAGGTTSEYRNHYDFGQKGFDLALDNLSGDMTCLVGSGYNWLAGIQRYQSNRSSTGNGTYMPWRYYYRLIYTANGIIESAGTVKEASTEQEDIAIRHTVGQALAVRGYAYFYLTQLYFKEYQPGEKVLPIYVDTKVPNHPKATQKEVCEQVISDLTTSAKYLKDFKRTAKFQANAEVANSYLAYMYGFLGEWAKMEEASALVKANANFTPMTAEEIVYTETKDASGNIIKTTGTGFADINTKGWIWGTDLTEDMGLNLVSFWGQLDVFSFSYASAAGCPRIMSDELYDRIRTDDVRKKQFVDLTAQKGSAYINVPMNKFYAPKREWGGQNPMTADYVYLRVSEMYLLHAEALAHQNKDGEAKAELKSFLNGRIANLSYIDGLNHDELIEELLLQTRIELWGEGRALFAFKRFKKDLKLGMKRFDSENQGQTIPWNDERLTYVIPNNEELNNPNLNK